MLSVPADNVTAADATAANSAIGTTSTTGSSNNKPVQWDGAPDDVVTAMTAASASVDALSSELPPVSPGAGVYSHHYSQYGYDRYGMVRLWS